MSKNTTLGIFLAVVMLCGSVPLGYSEPLRVQLEQGIETSDIQCDNSDHVLVQRTNGKLACVSEVTAEKMNWKIIENKINSVSLDNQVSSDDVKVMPTEKQLYDNISSVLIKSDKQYDPKDFPLNQYANELAKQRAPSPSTYEQSSITGADKLVRFDNNGNIFQYETALDNNFPISQSSPGTNGTVIQSRTFIIDQWIPTEIPDGQELKVVSWTGPLEVRGYVHEGLSLSYAPINEFYTAQNYTGSLHDINGFSVGGNYFVDPVTEDEILIHEQNVIDFGHWERDTILGKRALVVEGDNIISTIEINTVDYRFGLGSYRYNVAELTEILESIPALQP